jgi:hypothetical protein
MTMKQLMTVLAAMVFAITALGADIRVLTATEAAVLGATHEVTLTYADLAAETTVAATITNTAVFAVEANQAVEFVGWKLVTPFTTASDSTVTNSITLAIGDGTDTDRYMAATEICSDGTEVYWQFPLAEFVTVTNTVTSPTHRKLYTTSDTVDFLFTPGATTIVGNNTAGKGLALFRVR